MGMVADSRRRVTLLEANLVEDRRAVARAARRLSAHLLHRLSRPEVIVCSYALGALVGASGADIGRRLGRALTHLTSLGDTMS